MSNRTNQDENESFDAMSILSHLNELRVRFTYALVGLVVTTAISLSFTQTLLQIVSQPYCERLVLPGNVKPDENCAQQLITLSPTENIEIYFKLALTAGAMLAMPWFLFQAWKFVEPGLYKHERKYVYVFVPAASLLFIGGASFSWFILLPAAIQFLANFMSDIINSQWRLAEYVDFVRDFVFWLGISFEMPLIFYFLARFGIVSSQALRKQWRFAIVGIAVLAAVITPSIDPVTMLLTMLPLSILYLFSILLAVIGYRQFERIGRDDPTDLQE